MCAITNTEVRGLPCTRLERIWPDSGTLFSASGRETLGQGRDLRSRAGRLCSYGWCPPPGPGRVGSGSTGESPRPRPVSQAVPSGWLEPQRSAPISRA